MDLIASSTHGRSTSRRGLLMIGASLLALTGAVPAYAQEATTSLPPGGETAAPSAGPPATPDGDSGASTGGLTDIVVTARRVEERLQQVPLSVTAIGSGALADAQINQLSDLKAQVSNLVTMKTGTPGAAYVQLRGQVSGQLPNVSLDSRVGIYLDGVYIARAQGGSFTLADIARVEVLKGPQGTLYGHNVTGGSINFITSTPTGELGGVVESGFGNFGRQRYRASIDLPRFGGFSVHLGYVHDELNGDTPNLAAGRSYGPFVNVNANFNLSAKPSYKRVGGSNNDTFFGAVRFDGIDDLTVDYKFDYADNIQSPYSGQVMGYAGSFVGCAGAALSLGIPFNCDAAVNLGFPIGANFPAPFTSAAANNVPRSFTKLDALALDQSSPAKIVNQGHSLTLNYQASDDITLKSISSYRRVRSAISTDTDGGELFLLNDVYNGFATAFGLPAPLPAGGITPYCLSCSVQEQKQHQVSQEFQLIGRTGNFDYLGGLYYFHERGKANAFFVANFNPILTLFGAGVPPLLQTTNFVPDAGFSNGDLVVSRATSEAIFGRVTWHPTDKLDVLVGARYTHDKKNNTIDDVLAAAVGDVDPVTPGTQLTPLDAKVSFNRFTYEGTVTYKFTPDVNVFARYTTAYLAGGLFKNQRFDPETAKDVELGLKSEFFDRRVRFNIIGFIQTSKNLQVNGIVGSSGAIVLRNIGKLKTRGFEAEFAAVPVEGLTLGANIGYTRQRYSDGRAPLAPKWTTQVSATYDTPKFGDDMYLQVQLDANRSSRFYPGEGYPLTDPRSGFDGTPLPPQIYAGFPNQTAYLDALYRAEASGGYWLANARVSLVDIPLAGTRARVSGFVRNAFDKHGVLFATNYGTQILGNFEFDRTYGVDLRLTF